MLASFPVEDPSPSRRMLGTDFDSRAQMGVTSSRTQTTSSRPSGGRAKGSNAGAESPEAAGSGAGGTRQEERLRRVPEAAKRVGVLLAHPSDQGNDTVVLIDHLASAAAGQAGGSPTLGRQLVVGLVL